MTQKSREALFDLLTLSIYADAHISMTEERLLKSAIISKGWKSEYPKSLFIDESFARAREAADSDDAMFDYISEKAQAFTTKAAQNEGDQFLDADEIRELPQVEEDRFVPLDSVVADQDGY